MLTTQHSRSSQDARNVQAIISEALTFRPAFPDAREGFARWLLLSLTGGLLTKEVRRRSAGGVCA